MEGGGVVGWMRWWRQCGAAFDNARRRRGWAKKTKTECDGSVSGCFGAAGCREGCCGIVPPPSHSYLACGGGE
jgi:hypothetical protein